MRTTLDLPDDLLRAVKVRAAQTDRSITEVLGELLSAGLASVESGRPPTSRVQLPLVRNSRAAAPDELSPERVAAIMQEAEIDDLVQR